MHETSITASKAASAVAVAAAGYVSGDYVSILFGALAGALWPLSSAPTQSRVEGGVLLLKLILTACALSGFCAYLLEHYQAMPIAQTLGPIAFLITVVGNRWISVIDAMVASTVSLIEIAFKAVGERLGSFIRGGDKK